MAKSINVFSTVSPLDYRYYNPKFDLYLSENARIKSHALVEAALAKALAKKKICSKKIAEEISAACEKISAEEVYAEEEKTKHDIRALVNCIRQKVSIEAKPFVHFGATSYDIVDTASAWRYKKAIEKLVLPSLIELENTLIELALREKSTLQIGRTHGQHAEPITFGFAIAGYASRLVGRIESLYWKKGKLRGKFSGAVGAYNASSLLVENPLEFEKLVLKELGLEPSLSSTQIVEAEALVDLEHSLISTFGILANISDDLRNLQRSEIGEIAEAFDSKQVGSSTMPHKRNPINFENVKSFYKEFAPRMITAYLDQISEHQRDLTNSASQRFVPEIIAGLVISAERLNKTLKKLVVDKKNLQKNFEQSREMIVAEPLYILLAFYGHSDAHEYVKQLTLKAQQSGKKLMQSAEEDRSLEKYLKKFSPKQKQLLEKPEKYIGIAVKKTELICKECMKSLKEI